MDDYRDMLQNYTTEEELYIERLLYVLKCNDDEAKNRVKQLILELSATIKGN